jgi:hypothetical protein
MALIHAATSLLDVGLNAQLFFGTASGFQSEFEEETVEGDHQLEDRSHDWLIDERAGVPSVPATLRLAPSAARDVPLPTAPPNGLASARRTRRVLVSAR